MSRDLLPGLSSNVCRRNVPAEEKSRMLEALGDVYIKAGVKLGAELAQKISEMTA